MKQQNRTEPEFFSPQVSTAKRFYLNLKPSRNIALAVVSGGWEQCAANYEIHRSTFPFYSIEYVLRGGGRLKLNKRNYTLQAGMVFSYGPDVPHDIIAEANEPPLKYFLDFSGRN